jgi:hypothetical protein
MRKVATWLSATLLAALALLLPMTAFNPACGQAPGFALDACADGSAHLAMGCSSVSL